MNINRGLELSVLETRVDWMSTTVQGFAQELYLVYRSFRYSSTAGLLRLREQILVFGSLNIHKNNYCKCFELFSHLNLANVMSQGVLQLNFANSFSLIVFNLCLVFFQFQTSKDIFLTSTSPICYFYTCLQSSSLPTMDEEQKEEGSDKPTNTL